MKYKVELITHDYDEKVKGISEFKFDTLMEAAQFASLAADNYDELTRLDVSISWRKDAAITKESPTEAPAEDSEESATN